MSVERLELYPLLGALNKNSPKWGVGMSVKGLEPLTNGLKGRCSAIELHAISIYRDVIK